MKNSFHEPPIQKTHLGYGLAIQFVRSAVTRFHRIEKVAGSEIIPKLDVPMIIVSNHQNGLMDTLVVTTLAANHQVHWLTRADIYKKSLFRKILFGFNQMPIFRQRDHISDAKKRNQRIFEICVDRLSIGASIGVFPEGNHRAKKTLLPMRRGISDMVALSLRRNPNMKNLVVVPVGIDYEEAPSFRRRLSYRVGSPVSFQDLYHAESEEFDQIAFLQRLEKSMKDLIVDVQPEARYDLTLPFVRALRTPELPLRAFKEAQQRIQQFKSIQSDGWEKIEASFQKLAESKLLESVRPEDLSLDASSKRTSHWGTWLLAPLAFFGGLCSFPLAWLIKKECEKRVEETTFVSTYKASTGMFMFPLFWLIQSTIAALIAGSWSDGWSWTAFFAWYTFNLAGSRIAGFWYGLFLDWKGEKEAHRVWNNPENAQLWMNYVQSIQKAIVSKP